MRAKSAVPILTVFLLTWLAVPVIAQDESASEPKAGYSLGQGVVTQVQQVTLDALPQYSAPQRPRGAEAVEREFMPVSPAQYAAMKKAALQPRALIGPLEPSPDPRGVLENTPGTQLTISPPHSAEQSTCGGIVPSDHALSSSPAYLVQVVNACIIVLKASSGAKVSGYPKSLNTFFGAPAADGLGDSRTAYDSLEDRFIVTSEDFTSNTFYVAASDTSNPTGSWHIYNLGTQGSYCGDFPMLGLHHQENGDSEGGIYLSFDEFNCGSGLFVDDKILILPMTSIYSGKTFGFHYFYNLNFGNTTVDHVQPAYIQNYADRSRVEYLINTRNFNFGGTLCSKGCNGLDVWAIYNGVPASGQTPSLTGIHIGTANTYYLPADARQSGDSSCAALLDTGSAAITQMVPYAGGSLYATAETDSSIGTPAFVYWQVKPFVNDSGAITSATVQNEICWGCGGFTGDATGGEFYPTAQPDTEGNLVMVSNFSDASSFPSTIYILQRSSQATGGFHDGGNYLAGGQANYCQIDLNDGKNRWGDYTAASPIITKEPEFWFAGQFSQSNGNWGTAIGKAGFTSPSQP
jgi:hypothetical protein